MPCDIRNKTLCGHLDPQQLSRYENSIYDLPDILAIGNQILLLVYKQSNSIMTTHGPIYKRHGTQNMTNTNLTQEEMMRNCLLLKTEQNNNYLPWNIPTHRV